MGGSKEPSQYPSQRVIHPPGAGLHYTFPAKMTSIVTCMGGMWREEIHRPGSIMEVPREWSLLSGFIMYLGVTRGWPT